MAKRVIVVKSALMPRFYQDFHCVMGACKDNCCDDNWRIEFNKKDYLTVKRAVQEAGLEEEARCVRRLREREHDGYYAEFTVRETGRCTFHTPEGLCRLQLKCGAETLPSVCRNFPRRQIYTIAGLERSLSPACEGVLALLWDLTEGIDFVEEPLPKAEWRDGVPISPVAERFGDIRSLCIDVLQERRLKLSQRMLLLGLLLQRLRDADWKAADTAGRWLEQSEALLRDPSAASAALVRLPRQTGMYLSENLRVLVGACSQSQKELVEELCAAVSDDCSLLGTGSVQLDLSRYQELEGKLEELLGHSEHFFENLMVNLVFYTTFPSLESPENLWNEYVNLCNMYSFYRFTAVCGCHKEVSRERLFHVLVQANRRLLHNRSNQAQLRDELIQNSSTSLAHMAILLGG